MKVSNENGYGEERDKRPLPPLYTYVPRSLEKTEALLSVVTKPLCPLGVNDILGRECTDTELEDLRQELLRWQEAGYPNPKEWPLSSLCLRGLGLGR